MTLQETRDQFIMEYHFECDKRNTSPKVIQDKVIATWIAEGEANISDSLNILKKKTTISLTGDGTYHEYDLPTDFGCALTCTYNEIEVELVNISEMNTVTTSTKSMPNRAAIYHTGTKWVIATDPLDASSTNYDLVIWYNVFTGFYQPSASSSQNWGTFDGTTFTGNLKIPDKYYRLLLDYMLGKIYTEFEMKYRADLKSAKSGFAYTVNNKLPYKFAGLN